MLQLKHSSEQKDKERALQTRKEIYIEGAKAIAEAINDIAYLPNKIALSNQFEFCKNFLPAIAKIHMVGSLETIKKTTQFTQKFNQETLPLTPKTSEFVYLKEKRNTLDNLSKFQITRMNEINDKFEEFNRSGMLNPQVWDIYKKMFEDALAKHNENMAELDNVNKRSQALFTEILSMCLQASINLQKEALPVIVSIRKELGFPIDTDTYLSELKKVFDEYDNFFTPEAIKKLIPTLDS